MEQNPSLDADSHSADHKIPHGLWNLKVGYLFLFFCGLVDKKFPTVSFFLESLIFNFLLVSSSLFAVFQ
jgi:hypothetical protein